MTATIGAAVALGMVLVVPLGLRLIDTGDGPVTVIAQVWPLAGAVGAISLVLDRRSGLAVVLAGLYAAVAVSLALAALQRLRQRRSLAPVEIGVLTAMAAPSIAGVSLVAERGGWELLGFGSTTLALTVAHFHFAGFAAALVAGLVCAAAPSRLSNAAALSVPTGIGLVFVGYFTGDGVELAGAAVLTAAMWLVGWLVWTRVRPRSGARLTRVLFTVSASVLALTMVLALSWAAGQVWDGLPHLSLDVMAATHGVANALGFAVCGLAAWRLLQRERGRT